MSLVFNWVEMRKKNRHVEASCTSKRIPFPIPLFAFVVAWFFYTFYILFTCVSGACCKLAVRTFPLEFAPLALVWLRVTVSRSRLKGFFALWIRPTRSWSCLFSKLTVAQIVCAYVTTLSNFAAPDFEIELCSSAIRFRIYWIFDYIPARSKGTIYDWISVPTCHAHTIKWAKVLASQWISWPVFWVIFWLFSHQIG